MQLHSYTMCKQQQQQTFKLVLYKQHALIVGCRWVICSLISSLFEVLASQKEGRAAYGAVVQSRASPPNIH